MAGTTLDNDDLSPTQEYFIAGIVILLFGLLYWFFNSDWNSDSEYVAPSPAIPLANTRLLDTEKKGLTVSDAKPTEVVTASAVAASTAQATVNPATTPITTIPTTSIEEAPEADATKDVSKLAEVPDTAASANDEKLATAEPSDSAPSADFVKQDQNEKAEIPEVVENTAEPSVAESVSEAEPKTQPESNSTLASSFALPDGTPVKLASDGFEEKLQQIFANNKKNDALVFDQIYFDTGSIKLNKKSSQQIRATAAVMNAYPETFVLLRGYTDNKGVAKENIELSLMRANSMGLALGALGINTDRIRILGMGDSYPINNNNSEQGRKKNRRIEIILQ